MNSKDLVLERLEAIGELSIKGDLESGSYNDFSYRLLLLFFKDFEMLFTFFCGFVANLPISVLFNILTFNNVDFKNAVWIVYFIIYLFCFGSTIILAMSSFAFTITYVKIKAGKTIPESIRMCIIKSGKKEPLNSLKKWCVCIILFGVSFVLSILALFVINAFFLR